MNDQTLLKRRVRFHSNFTINNFSICKATLITKLMIIYAALIFIPNIAVARPRCWIGVIAQINPPWVIVSGEYDEEVILSLQQIYPEVKEGDWVIYWTTTHRVEPLRSTFAQFETQRLKQLIDQLSLPITDPDHHQERRENLEFQ